MANARKTINGLEAEINEATNRARNRVGGVLVEASDYLALLGADTPENRKLAGEICGLVCPSGGYVTTSSVSRVGVDAGGLWYAKGYTPGDLDEAMAEARRLVRRISDGITGYMVGKEAEAAERIRQLDASAR